METSKKLTEAVKYVDGTTTIKPSIGLILGSGLGDFAETLNEKKSISTENIPHYPKSTVEGHSGKLIFGSLHDKRILAVKGRVHFYEGYSMDQVTFSVRLMKQLGVSSLIVTNAAGGVNTTFLPGDLMIITSHINFFFANPLQGPNDETLGPRFPDMESDYDPEYVRLAESTAVKLGIRTQRGVYCASPGPTYETRAEVKMFQKIGADAVGMSTVPEVIVAKHQGIRVLGISCITNLGTGISHSKLDHSEVTETANRVKVDFQKLLSEIILNL